jgi:hypothetical protein
MLEAIDDGGTVVIYGVQLILFKTDSVGNVMIHRSRGMNLNGGGKEILTSDKVQLQGMAKGSSMTMFGLSREMEWKIGWRV